VKRLKQRFVLIFLCVSILGGSVGVAMPEQFCLMLGLTGNVLTAKANLPAGCCAASDHHSDQPPAEEDDCCGVEVNHLKLEPVSTYKSHGFDLALAPPVLLPFSELPAYLMYLHAKELLLYADSSPPLYGRGLLGSIHILNI
jgi:hypothetical protein